MQYVAMTVWPPAGVLLIARAAEHRSTSMCAQQAKEVPQAWYWLFSKVVTAYAVAICADHLKTSFSIGIAASMMAWGVLEFPQACPPCICLVVV